MNERSILMKKIMQYDFTLQELTLYLDTHPYCRNALGMFRKYNHLRKKAVEEYNRKYGCISAEDNENTERWTWIDDPWPWERS